MGIPKSTINNRQPTTSLKERIFWIAALFILLAAGACAARAEVNEGSVAVISNEFISLRVNAGDYDTGRISVDTTGGDIGRDSDDDKPLIYGHPVPWTSYTTIRIDGQDYIFGGPTKRRSGRGGPTGVISGLPRAQNRALVTTCRFGPVEVTQILSFARSLTTRMEDTAEITYRISNLDDKPHSIGIRVLLDTMLGDNDGAPFRVGEKALTGAAWLYGAEIPDYWLAFDSLSDPHVVAQGTLRGLHAVTPDRVCFTDWGTAADEMWSISVEPGTPFIRKDEEELDSAVALFWDPVELGAGASRTVTTYYGLGGVDIQPGRLTLGITAPAEVQSGKDKQGIITIIGYLENSGGFEARDVKAVLKLPEGLAFADDRAERDIGNMDIGEVRQMVWSVQASGLSGGKQILTLEVFSSNIESNKVNRGINILSPPRLVLKTMAPEAQILDIDGIRQPDPLQVRALLSNTGGSEAGNVRVYMIPGDELKLISGSLPLESIPYLGPGQEIEFKWNLSPSKWAEGDLIYQVAVYSTSVDAQKVSGRISVPRFRPTTYFQPGKSRIEAGGFIDIELMLDRLREFTCGQAVITYDPVIMEPVFISRGTLFVHGESLSEWIEPAIDRQAGRITISGSGSQPFSGSGSLCVLHFRTLQTGVATVQLVEKSIKDGKGKEIELPGCRAEISVE